MATNILFWNAEGLSNDHADKAVEAEEHYKRAKRAQERAWARHAGRGRGARITRSQMTKSPQFKAKHHSKMKFRSRWEASELVQRILVNSAQRKMHQFRHKSELASNLRRFKKFPHVFVCEVTRAYADSQDPTPAGNPNPATNCYAYYRYGQSTNFDRKPTTIQNNPQIYNGQTNINQKNRVPLEVNIDNMRFCFWHAPSANNGSIVSEVFDGLNASQGDFVLFGDLNVTPDVLENKFGMNPANIIAPDAATRISGKKLDYAITNAPDRFGPNCRALQPTDVAANIKVTSGSDHAPMILEFKG